MKILVMICLLFSLQAMARVTTGNEGYGRYVPPELKEYSQLVEVLRQNWINAKNELDDFNKSPALNSIGKVSEKISLEAKVASAKDAYDRKEASFQQALDRAEKERIDLINKKNAEIETPNKPAGPPMPKLTAEEKNYKPETCVWSNDIPKRLVFGPGCKDPSTKRICVGYVICDQKDPEGKFVRLSTCSAANCGESNEAAVACTKEAGYGSRKPSNDSTITVGASVQSIMLKTETVAE